MTTSLDRMMAAIQGTCKHPPVVVPYLQYYFPEIVDQLTPYTRQDLEGDDVNAKVEALSELHSYFDCDWVRVTTDPPWAMTSRAMRSAGQVIPAEQLLEEGLLDVAMALTRRFKGEKLIYGRVGLPYGVLFYKDEFDVKAGMIALKREPERCKRDIETYIPYILEAIRAWAHVGVHGLWLGQWLCSADMISEADYLEFVYPYDKIIVDAVHDAGLLSIYHYCGDVIPRLKYLTSFNPTVFGVEESKKGFDVPIGGIREGLGKDVCLLGNVNVYEIVERGCPESWACEVERQIREAGPERFIVSCGSPTTFNTAPQKLRDYVRTAKSVRDAYTCTEEN
jgi:uroporphyrinogen-III decarboxylase